MKIKHEVMLFTLETQSSKKLNSNGMIQKGSQMRAARAARLFFIMLPIKLLIICRVVVTVVVNPNPKP